MSDGRDNLFSIDWRPAGRVGRAAFSAAKPVLERALGIAEIAQRYHGRPAGIDGHDFMTWTLNRFGGDLRVTPADLQRVPATGPVVVVANHPFGAIEGIALALAMKRVRPDVKVLANFVLGRIPELREAFLLVDPFGGAAAKRTNALGLRRALDWLEGGGLLVVFPAGEVASFDLKARRVLDPAWSPSVAGLIRKSGAAAVPVFIPGRNGALFQAAGLIHPALRTALLPRQFLRRGRRVVELRVGSAVPAARLAELGDDKRAIAYMRDRTEILAERVTASGLAGATAVQPRRTPPTARAIVPPVPAASLAEEISSLPPSALLVEADELQVFVARAPEIPNVLREIGRLRELTFRDVGEGTGREIDLDGFDAHYLHMFLWNTTARQVAGAYRLGLTDELLAARGVAGLYTATLFRYDPKLFETMGPAIEMGRSWIRTEYQRSYAGLMLLWKGIGTYVARDPRHATLFGPVSISAEYRSVSQRLIVAFLERNRKLTDWARWVKPTNPLREKRRASARPEPASLSNLEEVSSFISEIEGDQKGVPVLLKQYLKLDGQLLGYNVDPDFANVLDVLIVVDLRRTASRNLQRYLGKEGLARFYAWHAEHGPAERAS